MLWLRGWAMQNSNLRPSERQSDALTNWANRPTLLYFIPNCVAEKILTFFPEFANMCWLPMEAWLSGWRHRFRKPADSQGSQRFKSSRLRPHDITIRPHRLSVRTQAFQAWKPGSTPGGVINRRKQVNCFTCERFMKTEVCFSSKKNNWVRGWIIHFWRKVNYCGSCKFACEAYNTFSFLPRSELRSATGERKGALPMARPVEPLGKLRQVPKIAILWDYWIMLRFWSVNRLFLPGWLGFPVPTCPWRGEVLK